MRTWHYLDFIPTKRRVRFTRNGHPYTDEKTRKELATVAKSWQGPKLHGPLAIYVGVMKPTPKGIKRFLPFIIKPDVDNVLKAILDGLNGVAFKDDAQVVLATVKKYDRWPDIKPGVIYELHEIGGDDGTFIEEGIREHWSHGAEWLAEHGSADNR